MLDLNNYVATSVSWPQLYYIKPWTETSEKCKKNIFSKPYWTRKASTVKSFADVA